MIFMELLMFLFFFWTGRRPQHIVGQLLNIGSRSGSSTILFLQVLSVFIHSVSCNIFFVNTSYAKDFFVSLFFPVMHFLLVFCFNHVYILTRIPESWKCRSGQFFSSHFFVLPRTLYAKMAHGRLVVSVERSFYPSLSTLSLPTSMSRTLFPSGSDCIDA